MKTYTIGDVERLLKLKDHVIRYWEKEIPLIQPAKDMYGRRLYSERDLQIFLRLKYLLYEKRFTLEGAREELLKELSGDEQDLRGNISALRSRLLDLYFMIENRRTETED
jgi:DNA-binding transcriptional MerR regulator